MRHSNEEKITKLFNEAQKADVQASPYLKARVLNELRSQRKHKKILFWWKASALSGFMALAVVILLSNTLKSSQGFEAFTSEPYVVRLERADLNKESFVIAQIILPDGVRFYSSSFPELAEMRELNLEWDNSSEQPFLPFVVKSEIPGDKYIQIKFFNETGVLINERKVLIKFKGERNV